MPKRALFVVAVLLMLLGHLTTAAGHDSPATVPLLVKLVPGLPLESQTAVIPRNGGMEISSIPALRLHVVEVAPADAASPWPDGMSGVSSLTEHAAVPSVVDDRLGADLLVEQLLDGVGSVAEQEAASETEPSGIDPWAEAFAESSRAALTPRRSAYPIAVNPQVQRFLDRFTGARREVVNLWAGRAGRYLGMIRDVLKARGLPEELAYTAMIESGFNPVAVSRAGAKGMWQFMAGTARGYGLRVDPWIDERLDPEKSTIAAAAYLRDLYTMFGSWTLALAAYNAGEVKVSRAIRATGSSDFWTLAKTNHLRMETRDFVPAIHAATLIAQDPGRYGFEFIDAGPLAVETVSVPASTDLRRLAPRTGIALDTLRTLNPVLVRAITPPGDAWQLKVPAGTRDDVMTALARPGKPTPPAKIARGGTLRPAASRGDVHVVRPRDTVGSIDKRYGVSVSDVLR
jgi:membrane-bound lytic murein transglycosylase D